MNEKLSDRLSVVMYHYVREIKSSRYPGIKGLERSDFIQQLKFFQKNFHVVTMEHVLAYYEFGEKLPEKALLLTFDDGYAEHFTQVYPILKEFNMQGSFYIPAMTVEESKVLDVNKIHFILSECADPARIVLKIHELILNYQEEYQLRDFDAYYQELAVANRFDTAEVIFIKRILQHGLPETLRGIITDILFEEFMGIDETAFSKELYMNKYQLSQMLSDGMHIGCHGYNHYWWDKLNSEQLQEEIDKSNEFLSGLGVDSDNWTACYPYGSHNREVVQLLEERGCKLAFTTEVDSADLKARNRLLLPRLDTNDFEPKSNNYMKLIPI